MTHTPESELKTPRIQTPCPKRWDELVGDEKRRFCSECCLHVHNGAALTRTEASALAAQTNERVCMRLELDPTGAPIFRDSPPQAAVMATRRRSFAALAAGWFASTAAGLLAACARSTPPPAPDHPPLDPGTTSSTKVMGVIAEPAIMGKVARPELMGDVAEPQPPPPPARLGEVSWEPGPAPTPPATKTPPDPR